MATVVRLPKCREVATLLTFQTFYFVYFTTYFFLQKHVCYMDINYYDRNKCMY